MQQIRTIKNVVQELKQLDANTAITENLIRNLCRTGEMKHIKSGNKFLLGIEDVIDFFDRKGAE